MAGAKRKAAAATAQQSIGKAWAKACKQESFPDTAPPLHQDWTPPLIPDSYIEILLKDLTDARREMKETAQKEVAATAAQAEAQPRQRMSERAHKSNRMLHDGNCVVDVALPSRGGAVGEGPQQCMDKMAGQAKAVTAMTKLQRFLVSSRSLSLDFQIALADILYDINHNFPDEVTLAAFRLLQQHFRNLPACKVVYTGGEALLLVNTHCWTPVPKNMHNARPLAIMLKIVRAACNAVQSGGTDSDLSLGAWLVLKHMVHVLQQDLLARLHMVKQRQEKGEGAATLLLSSVLWTVMKEDDLGWNEQADLVQECVKMIVAWSYAESETVHQPRTTDNSVASRSELVGIARVLLSLMFELYTALEACGLYGAGSSGRTAALRNNSLHNDRFKMDQVVKDAMVGSACLPELKTPEAKQALLLALHPRDSTRLLGQLLGHYDQIRLQNTLEMVQLEDYRREKGRGQSHFLWVDPVVVMDYIQHHWHWAKQAVFGGGMDNLLTFLSSLALGALRCGMPQVDASAVTAAVRALQQKLQDDKEGLGAVGPQVLCQWLQVEELLVAVAN